MSTFKNEVASIAAIVADLEQLIAGLRSEVQPVVLAAEESAPRQMARAVKGASDLAAVPPIADSRAGGLSFGAKALSLDTLRQHAHDLIALRWSLADGAAVWLPASGSCFIGTAAAEANDYVTYDSGSGALYYDADGNGVGAAVQFATLNASLLLTNADFLVT